MTVKIQRVLHSVAGGAVPLLMQLLANGLGKAMQEELSAWAPVTQMGDRRSSWLWQAQGWPLGNDPADEDLLFSLFLFLCL